MLAQLAARLRERQMGGAEGVGAGEGEGGTIVLDDNCEVGLHYDSTLLSTLRDRWVADYGADHVDTSKEA